MARILYAVAGEGMGHAVRSKAILDELSKEHEIIVATSNRAYIYLSRFFKTFHLYDLTIVYRKNSVSMLGTFFYNIFKLPFMFLYSLRFIPLILRFRPQIVISDFEMLISYHIPLLKLLNIPYITIDNVQVITSAHIEYPKRYAWPAFASRFVIHYTVPYADRKLITTFFYPEIKDKKAELFPPILRKEILQLKTRGISHIQKSNIPKSDIQKNHILVYQTSKSNKKMFPILKRCPEKFIIYGFDIDKTDQNLIFKKFNDTEFFDDLLSCKAVMMNASFTLMTESLYLNKPVLSIPVKKQFEQELNALYLDKLGYGKHISDLTDENLQEFLESLNIYKANLKNYKKHDNSKIFKRLRQMIKTSLSS